MERRRIEAGSLSAPEWVIIAAFGGCAGPLPIVGGSDPIWGEKGDDVILGGAGEDTIDAGSGNYKVYDQADRDTISGGTGKDLLMGGGGADTLNGLHRPMLRGHGAQDQLRAVTPRR